MSLVRSLDVLGAMSVPDTLGTNPKPSSPNLASSSSGASGTSEVPGVVGIPDTLGINSNSTSSSLKATDPDWSVWASLG